MALEPQAAFENVTSTGTLSALDETVSLELTNSSGAIVNISGTWVGTILFEGSNDEFITMQNASVFTPPAGVITTGVTTSNYYRFVAVSGFTKIRARMSSYTSGTATVVLSASIGAGLAPTISVNYDSMLGKNKITDGTNNALVSSGGGLIVAGLTAIGQNPINNPISVSGIDNGGLIRDFLTDTSGRQQILINDTSGNGITSTLFNSKQSLDIRPNTGFSTGVNTRPTVTNTTSTILAANINRKYVYIFNQSGTVIYLKFGNPAVVNQGIRVGNDEMFELTSNKLWTGTINAIRLAGSGEIEVFEGT